MSDPNSPSTSASKRGWLCKLVDWMKYWVGELPRLMKYEKKEKWLEDMRGSLNLTVSIMATITFQSALNPPGGVMQSDFKDFNEALSNCTSNATLLCPGQAVFANVYPSGYLAFLVCNTISFVASLSICLLLVSGLDLNHKVTTWLLLLCMWISITSLGLAYLFGAAMVTPFIVHVATSVFGKVVLAWIVLVAVLFGFLVLVGFVAWVWNTEKVRSSATQTIEETTSIKGTQTL